MHPCGLAIIMVTHAEQSSDRFDERSIGLDHLALRVPDRAALEAWAKRFDSLGVEHSGIKDENGGTLLVFRDPDNIQLELHAFDPEQVTTNIDKQITLADDHRVARSTQVAGSGAATPRHPASAEVP